MNKTLKTVLITLVTTFAVLFVAAMIFGDDTPTPIDADLSEDATVAPQNASDDILSGAASPTDAQSPDSGDIELTQEMIKDIVGYDIFSWNMVDAQGKTEIVLNIMRVWDASEVYHELSTGKLFAYIEQNLSDQANIFEVACKAEGIDPSPFLKLIQ